MKYLTSVSLLLLYFSVNSQVLNIDREGSEDTIPKKIKAFFGFSFSSDKQKKNLLDFNNTSEINYFFSKNYVGLFLAKTDLALNGKTINENNGYFQFRIRDNDTRKVAPDVFIQYQWNGILGLNDRSLGGLNARFKFLENRKSDLYIGLGAFYEVENWNPFISAYAYSNSNVQSKVHREMFRLNMMAKFALKISKNIDFAGISYLQSPLNSNFSKPRWFFDSNLNFIVNKHISFSIHYDHNLDLYRALPIENYYYSLTTGIQINL
jgi:hypothetical protein